MLSYNIANLNNKLCLANFFSYVTQFDIFFLYETHIEVGKEHKFTHFFKDYILKWQFATRVNKAGRARGGCVYGFKKSLKFQFKIEFKTVLDNILLEINFNQKTVHFIPRYLNCTNWHTEFNDFRTFLHNLNSNNFCLFGDLNARTASEQNIDENLLTCFPFVNNNRNSKDTLLDIKGKKLLELFEDIGGIVLNGRMGEDLCGEFTFCSAVGNSVIDYCVCSCSMLNYVSNFRVPAKSYSDHMPIITEFEFAAEPNTTPNDILPPRLHWKPNRANIYYNKLDLLLPQLIVDASQPVESNIENILCCVRDAGECMRSKKLFSPQNPWFDCECYNTRKKMLTLLNQFRKYNLEVFRVRYVEYRRKYTNLCHNKKLEWQLSNINRLNTVRCASDWWKIANSLKNKPITSNSCITVNDFEIYFRGLLSESTSVLQFLDLPNSVDPFLDSPFEMYELHIVLNNAKPNKSPGLDRIPVEFFKYAPITLIRILLNIFNHIFLRNEIPLSFKKSIIVPLLKKGDPSCPENYRGLSLLNAVYKIFTGLLLNRLQAWVDNRNILNEFQAGFRKGYSTIDNIFCLSSIIHIYFDKKKEDICIFHRFI